ncbi:MAG: glycerol-3-phosphate acyltransferase [Oscillospiraceae bacterium]|nr:glycerol-3-phosphate acyltransferase [Oscillospiraceae bacterium]
MTGHILPQILCCLLIGYLLGSINPSFLIGLAKGYDPRREGSGNAGASNTVIMAGKSAGLLVALVDICKATAAWKLCQALFPALRLAGILGGVAALLGHLFPVWLRFHGGRGLACLGGLCLAYDPKTLLLMLGIAILIGVLTNYVCVVTVSMSVIFPLYYGLVTAFWLGAAVLAIPIVPIFCKHLVNFRRIKSGDELRLSFLFNREKELQRIGRSE